MRNVMGAIPLSFLMAVGGGAALANSNSADQNPSSSSASSSQASGPQTNGQQQHGQANGQPQGQANGQAPVGFAEEEVTSAPLTVERVDQKNRNLFLRAPGWSTTDGRHDRWARRASIPSRRATGSSSITTPPRCSGAASQPRARTRPGRRPTTARRPGARARARTMARSATFARSGTRTNPVIPGSPARWATQARIPGPTRASSKQGGARSAACLIAPDRTEPHPGNAVKVTGVLARPARPGAPASAAGPVDRAPGCGTSTAGRTPRGAAAGSGPREAPGSIVRRSSYW